MQIQKTTPIPDKLLAQVCVQICQVENNTIPYKLRGITINRPLIKAALEILHAHPQRTLPQNCRNDIRKQTPDGLDFRLKKHFATDLRMANIISDVLASAQIAELVQVINPKTGRLVKGTRLKQTWCWGDPSPHDTLAVEITSTLQHAGLVPKKAAGKASSLPVMNKTQYLGTPVVKEFIQWMAEMLDGTAFTHKFKLLKTGEDWSAVSLYTAFEGYRWPFTAKNPDHHSKAKNTAFDYSFTHLNQISVSLRQSINNNDLEKSRQDCLSILEWGGVKAYNEKKINELGDCLCSYFREVREKLELKTVCTGINQGIIMNSGFTKIYALLVDDFIIYDGRVGAALGLLSRLFCEDQGHAAIPGELRFSYGKGREHNTHPSTCTHNRRDPSTDTYKYPQFLSNRQKHLDDNIRASWLLKQLIETTNSRFNSLSSNGPLDMRLWALQSALFMIGYNVRGFSKIFSEFSI